MANLFALAEMQLIKERRNKEIKDYTLIDIVNYAVRIRKYLDFIDRNKKVAQNRWNKRRVI